VAGVAHVVVIGARMSEEAEERMAQSLSPGHPGRLRGMLENSPAGRP
jgi:hypothetical protein